MKQFHGKVAVVTGAASGIGRAIAERCCREGMRVVLSDIEETALSEASETLRVQGATVHAVRADVSAEADVQTLADRTIDAFGAIHVLFNNAGVGIIGPTTWETALADWVWIVGVNLWGVIHGVRVFLPIMLEQDADCHIVNAASIAGLTMGSGLGAYQVTKHGIVSLSETLSLELSQREARVRVSVLCPGIVNTRILESTRNRPAGAKTELYAEEPDPERTRRFSEGMSPQKVAELVFAAIRAERLYVITHGNSRPGIEERFERILLDCPAESDEASPG